MPSSTSNFDTCGQLKGFFTRIACFAGGLILCFVLIDVISGFYNVEYHEPQFEEMRLNREKADLIVVGSSQSLHGINPKYLDGLGYRAYNFSMRGGGIEYFRQIYNWILRDGYTKPRLVVYQLDWFVFDPSQAGRLFEDDCEFFSTRVFMKCLLSRQFDWSRLLKRRFSMLKMRSELASWSKQRALTVKSLGRGHLGYAPCWGTWDEVAQAKDTFTHPTVDPARVKYLELLLDDLKRDGVDVILVQVPNFLPGRKNKEAIRDINKRVRVIADKYGVPFLDYNGDKVSELNRQGNLFTDGVHLNEEGAAIFSATLRNDLADCLKTRTDGQASRLEREK
jgi:hypothetical protein